MDEIIESNALLIECSIGPDVDGAYLDQVITWSDYELLCVEGDHEDFCDCDVDNIFGYDELGDR